MFNEAITATVSFVICFSQTYETTIESLLRWYRYEKTPSHFADLIRICVKAYLQAGELDCDQIVFQELVVDLIKVDPSFGKEKYEVVEDIARMLNMVGVREKELRESLKKEKLNPVSNIFSTIIDHLIQLESADQARRDEEAAKIIQPTVDPLTQETLQEDSLEEISFEGSPHSFIEDTPLLMRGRPLLDDIFQKADMIRYYAQDQDKVIDKTYSKIILSSQEATSAYITFK